MNILLLLPGLFTLLDRVLGPLVAGHAASITEKIMGSSFDGTADGLLNIIEGTVGKVEDQKKLELKAELQTLLAQASLDTAELNSPKPWYVVPHEIAEMFADAYLATGFVIGIIHMTAYMFGYNVPLAGYESVTVGIALSFSGLIKGYKAISK